MDNGPLAQLVEHLICNEGVAGSNPVRSTNDDKDMPCGMSLRVSGGRRHVLLAGKTAESGSRNFASDGEQNIRDHKDTWYDKEIICEPRATEP